MTKNYTRYRYNVDVDSTISRKLLDLNRRFYTDHARDFSETRARLQSGVRRVMKELRGDESILDLGCGNGELARMLSRRGHHGSYVGLDFSLPLLGEAPRQGLSFPAQFIQSDLAGPEWGKDGQGRDGAVLGASTFDLILAFAVLHHIPGRELRLSIACKVHDLLKPAGLFIHSNWQFLNSPRLAARIQSWDQAGISRDDLEPGDYLLDWKRGAVGLRYVHHFTEEELEQMARDSGFQIVESFYSDGANTRLGLYQIWKRAEAAPSSPPAGS